MAATQILIDWLKHMKSIYENFFLWSNYSLILHRIFQEQKNHLREERQPKICFIWQLLIFFVFDLLLQWQGLNKHSPKSYVSVLIQAVAELLRGGVQLEAFQAQQPALAERIETVASLSSPFVSWPS